MKANEQAVMAAKSVVYPAAERGIALAAGIGVAVTIKTSVYAEDGSKHWATTLALLLCENPELAKGTRQRMAEMITAALELAEPFEPSRLSKPLTEKAKEHVAKVLTEYGYECSTLTNGLSIRDIVKQNIRTGSAKPTTISTKFYADHIEMDGVSFQFRPRERTPMGEAHHDFSIRVAGIDVPLMAVLKLRNIGLAEFNAADNKAVATATDKQRNNRNQLDREYRTPPSMARFYERLQAATREADREQDKARVKYAEMHSKRGDSQPAAASITDKT